MKKWLSYRERSLLGRDLTMDEADYLTQMTRRIAAILLLSDALNGNHRACKAIAEDRVHPIPAGNKYENYFGNSGSVYVAAA